MKIKQIDDIEKIRKKIAVDFLRYLRKKGEDFVEQNRLAVFQVSLLLSREIGFKFFEFLQRLRNSIKFNLQAYPVGRKIADKKVLLDEYIDKINKLGMSEQGGLDLEIQWFCRDNKIPDIIYHRLIKDLIETNGDIILSFELFYSFKKLNFDSYLESDKYKCILHFPKHYSDTLKIEIFKNTTPQNIRDFVNENQNVIKKWQVKTKYVFKRKTKDFNIKEIPPSLMPSYIWNKTPKKGLFRKIVFYLEDRKKIMGKSKKKDIYDYLPTDIDLVDTIFGEQNLIAKDEQKKLNVVRKIRERHKKSSILF